MSAEGTSHSLAKGATVEIVDGEIRHNGPMNTVQNYSDYTEEDQEVWRILYQRQWDNLQDKAYTKWLDALGTIGLNQQNVPRLSVLAEKLDQATKWLPVPVSGFLPGKDYFLYLAHRHFPTVPKLRTREELEFIVEPDLFHDAFGHLPMHTDPDFADFVQLYGKVCFQVEDPERIRKLGRLYWFTVEYALIEEDGKLKVCGAGHMSGMEESKYSLTDEVEKKPYVLEDVLNQEFDPHNLQPLLFILDSYEQVCDGLAKLAKDYGVTV